MFKRSKKLGKHRESKIWKLLRIHDFNSLMQPCISVISISGFFPHKTKSTKYVFSRRRFVWSIFVLVIYICCCLWSSYRVNCFGIAYGSAADILRYNICMSFGSIIHFVSFFKSRSKFQALQRLSDVSRTLSPQIFRKIASVIYIKDPVTLIMLSSYLIYAFSSLVHCISWYALFITSLQYMMYVNSVRVLEACLEKINESLIKLRRTLITDEPHLLRRVYHTKKNPLLIRDLKILRERYLEISEIVNLLNDSFGLEIFGMVGMSMLQLTFNLYDFLYMLLNDQNYSVWWLLGITFVIYFSGNLIYMAWVCEAVREQAKEIGSNIHQNLVATFDEQLSTELELFSMQVLQLDMPFSAMGLTIDAGLLTKVASSIATYLLILIQFLLVKSC